MHILNTIGITVYCKPSLRFYYEYKLSYVESLILNFLYIRHQNTHSYQKIHINRFLLGFQRFSARSGSRLPGAMCVKTKRT